MGCQGALYQSNSPFFVTPPLQWVKWYSLSHFNCHGVHMWPEAIEKRCNNVCNCSMAPSLTNSMSPLMHTQIGRHHKRYHRHYSEKNVKICGSELSYIDRRCVCMSHLLTYKDDSRGGGGKGCFWPFLKTLSLIEGEGGTREAIRPLFQI